MKRKEFRLGANEFTSEELDRAEFYFDDARQAITIIVRGAIIGGDLMSFENIENEVEYFKRRLKGK